MTDDRSEFTAAREAGLRQRHEQRLAVAVCRSNAFGEGCGHPTTDHVGDRTTQVECCCCTRLINDMTHVDGCLDCSIKHGKRQVRLRTGNRIPLVFHVEPYIAEGLKTAFWRRYIGEYFDDEAAKIASNDKGTGHDQEGA